MIVSCENHDQKVLIPKYKNIGVRLVTCSEGTYAELWSFSYNRPVKNGKLFMVDKNGLVTKFRDVNPDFVNVDDKGIPIIGVQ